MKNFINFNWLQISQRQRMSPFPNVFSMEAVTSTMKDYFGFCYDCVLLFFKENLMFVYIPEDNYNEVGQKALKLLKNNPKIFVKLTRKINRLGASLLKLCQHIYKEDLTHKSDKQLLQYYLKYYHSYKKVYGLYFFILSLERFLINDLKNYLVSKKVSAQKIDEYMNILTFPSKAMFVGKEHRDLLCLVNTIRHHVGWKKYFYGNIQKIEEKIHRNSGFNSMIKKHYHKYFWLSRDYEDPIWDKNHVILNIKKIINKSPTKELEKIKKADEELDRKIKDIEKKIPIDQFYRQLFSAMRDGTYYKELRKKIVSLSLYYTDSLLMEIGQRTNLTLSQVRQFLAKELKLALIGHKNFNKILTNRKKIGAFFVKKGNSFVWQGEPAEKIFKKIMKIPKNIKEIHGISACPGKVSGRVKIVINPKDCSKIQKGDIMVTVQAVPSFSTAIIKSKALVADGGPGITSHPATLAREAGIPCIVNAKIATQVLKDGDKIEVDANKGVIKILK